MAGRGLKRGRREKEKEEEGEGEKGPDAPAFDLPSWMETFDTVSPSSSRPATEAAESPKRRKRSAPPLTLDQLSPQARQELTLPVRNLLQYVLFFQDRPPGTRFVLDPNQSYVMPLQYAVRTMWLLFQEKDLPVSLRPEIIAIWEEVLKGENVVMLTFMFLCLLNASETSVYYVRHFSPEISEKLYLWFLRMLQLEFLKFGGRTNALGLQEANIDRIEYRSPLEFVLKIVSNLSALGNMPLPSLTGGDEHEKWPVT